MAWTTAGDGTFNDVTIPDAIYTPGAQDIANGGVTLTITASQGTQTMTDEMTVSVQAAPAIEIPQTFLPITACMGVIDINDYIIITNADAVEFTSNGDGEFNGNVYTFGTQDIANGDVTITITAIGCGEVSETMTVEYIGVPTMFCIDEMTTCENPVVFEAFLLTPEWGDIVGWTTSGTGTIDDQTPLIVTYTPSEADINSGSVVLTAEYVDCQGTSYYHNVTITFMELGTPSTPVGPVDVYNYNAETQYSVEVNPMYTSYEWTLEPATAGTMTPNGNTVSISWNMDQPDTDVSLSVIGHNDLCGDSEPSEALSIS